MCCYYQPDAVHGAGLEVDQHGAGHVLAAAGLVVVHVDPLELLLQVPLVPAIRADPVLGADNLTTGAEMVRCSKISTLIDIYFRAVNEPS